MSIAAIFSIVLTLQCLMNKFNILMTISIPKSMNGNKNYLNVQQNSFPLCFDILVAVINHILTL